MIGVDYVPLTIYAVAMVLRDSLPAEVAGGLSDKEKPPSRYAAQSLFLLVPLVVPAFAIVQELRARK